MAETTASIVSQTGATAVLKLYALETRMLEGCFERQRILIELFSAREREDVSSDKYRLPLDIPLLHSRLLAGLTWNLDAARRHPCFLLVAVQTGHTTDLVVR